MQKIQTLATGKTDSNGYKLEINKTKSIRHKLVANEVPDLSETDSINEDYDSFKGKG